ncbi:MAG: 6-carboxytetrahydropterin synthase QueD [Gammaproteobacteria bacterium]|nr:6-carboxytetrahydropterin synthase QueD [Gammaproteobacteria bacterium]
MTTNAANEKITITRRLEFDAGHRLPNHKSQCRNIHGHRYAIEITLTADIIKDEGATDDGMVMDFGDIKAIANEKLVNLWDHAFLVWRGDTVMRDFLAMIPDHKTVVLDEVPTAENLVKAAFMILQHAYHDSFGHELTLARVRLYETPNCWADCSASEVK